MDFHAGLEEHPSPGPLQKGNGTVGRSLPVSAHSWECQEHPGPVGKGRVQQQPRSRALLVPSPKLLLEQQNSTGCCLAGAQQDFLQMQTPERAVSNSSCQAGLSCCCSFWILLHPIPACPGNTESLPCLFPAHRLRKLFSPTPTSPAGSQILWCKFHRGPDESCI